MIRKEVLPTCTTDLCEDFELEAPRLEALRLEAAFLEVADASLTEARWPDALLDGFVALIEKGPNYPDPGPLDQRGLGILSLSGRRSTMGRSSGAASPKFSTSTATTTAGTRR